MPVQAVAFVLGQDDDSAEAAVDEAGQREIDQPVLAPEGTAGFARSRVNG